MSLTLITNPTSTLTLSSQWTDFVNREDHSNIGVGTSIPIFRLTNWDTGTARPLVAEGSIVEVGGSLYQADSDTALVDDTGLVDGLCFIKMVPGTGTPDPGTVVPTLTSDTMPSFDAEQGGWYDGNNKFLPVLMTRSGSGTSYVNKGEYVDQNQNVIRYIDGGTYMSGAAQVGGALTVGAGATFSGAVSGVTSLSIGGALTGVSNLSASGDISCDDISCDDISCDDISMSGSVTSSLSIDGSLSPRASSVTGSVSIAASGTYTFPRGAYLLSKTTGVDIKGYISSIWQTVHADSGGFIFSDGTNVRANNTNGSSTTLDWLRF